MIIRCRRRSFVNRVEQKSRKVPDACGQVSSWMQHTEGFEVESEKGNGSEETALENENSRND